MKASRFVGGRLLCVLAMWCVTCCGCGGSGAPTASIPGEVGKTTTESASGSTPVGVAVDKSVSSSPSNTPTIQRNLFPEVVIKTSVGDIRIKLNGEKSPTTVQNFLDGYVDRGFYSNTIFHHVDPGFVMAGGYTSDLQEPQVRAPIRNEADNGLKNVRGTLTMFRLPDYSDSATSHFMINVTDAPQLDYDESASNLGYCVFGEVVQGMDVVERIAHAPTQATADFPKVPVERIVIQSIERVER